MRPAAIRARVFLPTSARTSRRIDHIESAVPPGFVWTPVISLVTNYPRSCALRIKAGTDVFDPAYRLDFAQLTQGREGAVLRYLGNGKALLDVFHKIRGSAYDMARVRRYTGRPRRLSWAACIRSSRPTCIEAPSAPGSATTRTPSIEVSGDAVLEGAVGQCGIAAGGVRDAHRCVQTQAGVDAAGVHDDGNGSVGATIRA